MIACVRNRPKFYPKSMKYLPHKVLFLGGGGGLFDESVDPVHKTSLNDVFTNQTELLLNFNSLLEKIIMEKQLKFQSVHQLSFIS